MTTWADVAILFQPIANDILDAAITIGVGWCAVLYHKATGADLDAKARDALHSAVMTAATELETKLDGGILNKQIDPSSPVLNGAIDWVTRSVPDALKRFKLSDYQIAQLIISKIGLLKLQVPQQPDMIEQVPVPMQLHASVLEKT